MLFRSLIRGFFNGENPTLFRRKRRVLRTRGVLWERAAGAVLHKGPNLAFVGLERVVSPPWGENRLTGPHRPEKLGAFPQEKTGAAHPRVSLRPSHRLGLAHRAKQAGPGSVLLGAKKPLPGFVGQRPVDCLIHLFSKNVPQCPHKRKAMRSVSWSVTRRKTGFPRIQIGRAHV